MSSQKADDPASRARPADWELPAGVDRGLWDYVTDPGVARGYDAGLAGSALFRLDQQFVERHCPVTGRLIDLGCGTGRLLIALARRGNSVLGVDLSAEMLAVASEKARQAGVPVQMLRANLTELDCLAANCFDAAACLFSTLGMIRGADQRRRVVAHAHRLLKPGARLLLHVHNRWFNLWTRDGRHWLARNTLGALLGRTSAGDRLMPVHQGVANLTLHLFTHREVCRLLKSVGFRIVEVQPISLRSDGKVCCPWWLGKLRAYGYLIAAEKR